jgi:hypothetical protein
VKSLRSLFSPLVLVGALLVLSAMAAMTLSIGAQVTTNPNVTGVPAPQSAVAITGGTISGTSVAATTLSSTSTTTFSGVTTGTNADFVCMAAGGVLTLQTSSCTISSIRFKTDVELYQDAALAAVRLLHPVAFNMKPQGAPNPDPNFGTRQIGLLAENVAAVDPRMAIYERDGKTPKSYRQEALIALLVKAIQEQQLEILSLRRTVQGLTNGTVYTRKTDTATSSVSP